MNNEMIGQPDEARSVIEMVDVDLLAVAVSYGRVRFEELTACWLIEDDAGLLHEFAWHRHPGLYFHG